MAVWTQRRQSVWQRLSRDRMWVVVCVMGCRRGWWAAEVESIYDTHATCGLLAPLKQWYSKIVRCWLRPILWRRGITSQVIPTKSETEETILVLFAEHGHVTFTISTHPPSPLPYRVVLQMWENKQATLSTPLPHLHLMEVINWVLNCGCVCIMQDLPSCLEGNHFPPAHTIRRPLCIHR